MSWPRLKVTVLCVLWPTPLQERPAERGRLHQVRERHQPVQAPTRRDHQPPEEHRRARGAGGGVRAATDR